MVTGIDIALFAARVAISVMFVASALDKFRLDPVELKQISSLHLPAPATLERLTGLAEIIGAAALTLGPYARAAAIGLALFVAFVSIFFLRFWSFEGPDEARTGMRNAFLANVAVIGGLTYVAALGPGAMTVSLL